jgi:CheY-like chemotaxis protein
MPLRPNQACEIVLIDDDEDDYLILKHAFLTYSDQIILHHLNDTNNLLAPLQQAQNLPSLILLDMHLGMVDGFEVLASLKQDPHLRDIPVVVWSGSLLDEEVNRCYRAGAGSVVHKSTDQPSLERVMGQLCAYWLDAVQLPFYQKQSDC